MKFLLTILFILPFIAGAQQKALTIEVSLTGMPDSILFYLNESRQNIDSAYSKDGSLRFSYTKKSQQVQGLTIFSIEKKQAYVFWMENQPLKLRGVYGEPYALSAEGSRTQNEFKEYMALTERDADSLSKLKTTFSDYKAQNNPDTVNYKAQIGKLTQVLNEKNSEFLKTHTTSVISTYMLLLETKRRTFSPNESISLFSLLDKEQQNSGYGQDILRSVHLYQNPQVGQSAPNFTLKDMHGKSVSLSDFKGKNIVLIFWSSWCIPCRKEAPELKKAYEAYKNKNFVFISISLDENRDAWLQAIKKDGMNWFNVADLKGWTNEAALIYGVSAIPEHFLIDGSGRIVAKTDWFSRLTENMDKLSEQ